jgi:hypothetical protein
MKFKKIITNDGPALITTAKRKEHLIITYFIAAIWIVNGLFCKVLGLIPRHELIVARILGDDHSKLLTIIIGISELFMAAWIVNGRKSRLNAMTQIAAVVTMNTIEFILAPDLLLWGRFNALFAAMLVILIYYNEYHLNKRTTQQY